jgi:hypothetical protein
VAEYQGGLIIDVGANSLPDESIGALLDALKQYDGALTVEPEHLLVVFSLDASDLPGVASGLAAAIPQVVAIATRILRQSNLVDRVSVIGMSIERVPT